LFLCSDGFAIGFLPIAGSTYRFCCFVNPAFIRKALTVKKNAQNKLQAFLRTLKAF